MSGRISQEIAQEKADLARAMYQSVLERINNSRNTYNQSFAMINKSRAAITRSNGVIGRHGLKDLYRP